MAKQKNKDSRIRVEVRLTAAQKSKLKSKAEDLGISMTEMFESYIDDVPIVNKHVQKAKFDAIHALTKEMNYIGNNINQLTIAIRQIRAEKRIEDGEYQRIINELNIYNSKRNFLAELLIKESFS